MDYIVLSIPVFFLLIGLELLISKIRKSDLYKFNDAVTNISCGITQQVTGVLAKTALVVGYIYLFNNFRIWDVPNTWWTYTLLFLGIDFFYYWFHRLSHEINLLWGAHIVHHQSEEYNFSVALRQSSFQGFFSMIFYLPLALIGFNPVAFVTINAFQTLYQFWIHTKTIKRLPAIVEYIFNTPSHHRVHHGRNPKYIDKNHGGTLIVFDRLFGSFQQEEEEVVYGVTKPLSSWNPIWANFDYYADLANDLIQPMNWRERIKMVFAVPGWRPESLGGYQPPGEVTADTAIKYQTTIPVQLNYYILFQYLIVLAITTVFLFSADEFSRIIQLLISLYIFFSVLNLGAIFELKKWVLYVEILRILILSVVGFWLVGEMGVGGGILISAVSISWFLRHRYAFKSEKPLS